jgi:hypothetical protein
MVRNIVCRNENFTTALPPVAIADLRAWPPCCEGVAAPPVATSHLGRAPRARSIPQAACVGELGMHVGWPIQTEARGRWDYRCRSLRHTVCHAAIACLGPTTWRLPNGNKAKNPRRARRRSSPGSFQRGQYGRNQRHRHGWRPAPPPPAEARGPKRGGLGLRVLRDAILPCNELEALGPSRFGRYGLIDQKPAN